MSFQTCMTLFCKTVDILKNVYLLWKSVGSKSTLDTTDKKKLKNNTFSSVTDIKVKNVFAKAGYKRVYGYRGSEIWLMAIRVDLFRDSGRACVCLCPGWERLNRRAAVWSLLSIISVTQREARPLASFRSAIYWGCLSVWQIFSVLSFSLDSQRKRRRYISPPAAKDEE